MMKGFNLIGFLHVRDSADMVVTAVCFTSLVCSRLCVREGVVLVPSAVRNL